jgi:phosphinothricin acetyltransferase
MAGCQADGHLIEGLMGTKRAKVHVRHARAGDMAAIAAIVNAHIADGVAHFGDAAIEATAWRSDWETSRREYPWYVAEVAGEVVGLAWAKRFNPRAAYDWSAEVSAYLRPGEEGRGVGSVLYERLLATLDAQGYRCLLAGITTPNGASVRLHERFGFVAVGTTRRVGYKHGAWRDVGFWQRLVGPPDDSPPPAVRPVGEIDPEV